MPPPLRRSRSAGCFGVAEAYPELKANEVFLELQEQLSDIEALLASARNYYNAVVRRYNTRDLGLPGQADRGQALPAGRVLPGGRGVSHRAAGGVTT